MVTILLGNGFEEAEALVPADLLRRAGIQVVLAALEGDEATGGHGITVRADTSLAQLDPQAPELVMIPGGLGGVDAIRMHPGAMNYIQSAYDQGRYVAAICAGPTVLAELGLLNGRKAVCYPGMEDQLAGADARKGAAVVVDGRIVTGEAAGSAFAFGLKLVEVLRGREAAQRVSDGVCYHGEML